MPLAFTGHDLDKDDHARADPEQLARLRARDDARLLALDGLMPLFDDGVLLTTGLTDVSADAELVYLGLREGSPLFVAVPAEGDQRNAITMRETMLALMRLPPA